MSFNQFNFDSAINKAITACGYTQPTPIQARSIPEILNGFDLVACAQTGTGKTAAFVLPALQRIREKGETKKPRILILTPTRELAAQVTQAAKTYGKFLRFHMANLVGGMSYRQQIRDLSRPVDVIVATPGRLLDHMENGRINLSGIEMLVLDEADRMLDMGFIDDVQAIAKATPKNRQTLLFSATVDGKLTQVIKQLLKEPVHIDLAGEKISPAKIKQVVYMADSPSHKNRLLEYMLANDKIFKAIIFSATKIGADQLAAHLSGLGYSVAPLHGDLKQSLRNRTVEQLRRNKIQFLVATDVAARGIDIPDMTHVINYDMPRFCEDYVHRIGRTGRAGKSGIAISFALRSDQRHIDRIEKYIGQPIDREIIEGLEPSKNTTKAPKGKGGHKKFEKSFGRGRKNEGARFGKKSFSSERKKHGKKDSAEQRKYGSAKRSEKSFEHGRSKNNEQRVEKRSFTHDKKRRGNKDSLDSRTKYSASEKMEKSYHRDYSKKEKFGSEKKSFSPDRRNQPRENSSGKKRKYSDSRTGSEERTRTSRPQSDKKAHFKGKPKHKSQSPRFKKGKPRNYD